MRSVTVTLDGVEYTVQEKRSKANKVWRSELEAQFADLAGALANAPDTDITDGRALAGLVQNVSGALLHSVDTVTELVHAYAPELQLEDAYDSEILAAFTAVLGLAYPFGSVVEKVMEAAGRLRPQT